MVYANEYVFWKIMPQVNFYRQLLLIVITKMLTFILRET